MFIKTFHVAVAVLLLSRISAVAAPVRVSFLVERDGLPDTLTVLKNSGCTQEAMSRFKKAVENYQATALVWDFDKFPKSQKGFFHFESASHLVAALPHQLCDSKHAYDFNCFDTLITVAAGRLRTGLRPDDIAGPFLVPHMSTNGGFMVLPAATPRDAFSLVYQPWYRDATKDAFSQSGTRISLTAALFRCHALPGSTTEPKLGSNVFESLRASWRRDNVLFPQDFEVVLCHQASFPQRMFLTAHAGLLFPRKKGYTYIEKAGGSGPFVRLDFDDRADLLTWLSGMFRGAGKLGYTHHFVTFNDTKIEMLEFTK